MKAPKIFVLIAAFLMLAPVLADAQQKPRNPLVGNWFCEDEGTKVEIRADGTLTIDGAEFAYKVKNSIINVVGDDGAMAIPFQIDGDTLTVEVEGREMVYTRIKDTAKPKDQNTGRTDQEGVIQAFVGKWCYMSNLTGTNSRMSNRCFVLNGNGTYQYSSETSSSGTNGSSASQEFDSGRWTATRTTLTAHSDANGKTVYPIELRNHPKTGDPMIVVDGDAYVTAYQKSAWE